jgi:hypothetical protein
LTACESAPGDSWVDANECAPAPASGLAGPALAVAGCPLLASPSPSTHQYRIAPAKYSTIWKAPKTTQ